MKAEIWTWRACPYCKKAKQILKKNKIEFKEIFSIKGNILSKLMSLIYLLDYTSIYKACRRFCTCGIW